MLIYAFRNWQLAIEAHNLGLARYWSMIIRRYR